MVVPASEIRERHDKIMFVSTWGISCGIAMYTKDLMEDLEKLYPGSFIVRVPDSSNRLSGKLVHLQHEFGIMPKVPIVGGKVIITWHSITRNIMSTMMLFESILDVVAHIALTEGAREYIRTTKDVHIVSLGSKLMNTENIKKEDARKSLGIDNIQKPIGFVFGFQSPNKNYARLANAARSTGIHLIISGSTHCSGYRSNLFSNEYVTFLNRHLTDEEIDMFALASDILLFDYVTQDHHSSSSALHRTVGSGRPVVCANTKHFGDIREEADGALKFNSHEELDSCIRRALERKEELGNRALEFAKRTSREEVAKRHMELYRKYVIV